MTGLTYNQVLDHYFYLTGVVLVIYDHFLTLESEGFLTDRTRASAWYLLVRYFALCANVAIFALSFVDFSVKVCANQCITLNTIQDVVVALQELMVGTTLILRVFALYSFDKRVMASLASTAIIVICVFIQMAVASEPPHVDRTSLSGCYSVSSNAR
ncbi:hypothetical protein C8R45DRAFT_1044224, partial [Mycena sanguinolenta]